MKTFILSLTAIIACLSFSSCDSHDEPGSSRPVTCPMDSVWYEITHQQEFTPIEFTDSINHAMGNALSNQILVLQTFIPEHMRIKVVDFRYRSSDGMGGTTTHSAQLIIPVINHGLRFKQLVIDNRATQMRDADVPTHQLNVGALLALRGTPVVTADLLGFGASVAMPFAYCCHHSAAKNTVDAAIIAQLMLHSDWLDLGLDDEPLPVYNVGYSQGGYDALAVHRYLETEASETEKWMLPLVNSRCGAGPYDMRIYMENVLSKERYDYFSHALAAAMSISTYHPEVFPAGFTVNDLLSEKVSNSGLIDMICSKQFGNDELIFFVNRLLNGEVTARTFLSEEVMKPGSPAREILLSMGDRENLLEGWTPTRPITFFHATHDECIPIECTLAAMRAFGNSKHVTLEEYETESEENLHVAAIVPFLTNIYLYGLD